MAPHRQKRITILIAAFAAQIPLLAIMALLGLNPERVTYVLMLPVSALAWVLLDKRKNP